MISHQQSEKARGCILLISCVFLAKSESAGLYFVYLVRFPRKVRKRGVVFCLSRAFSSQSQKARGCILFISCVFLAKSESAELYFVYFVRFSRKIAMGYQIIEEY